MAWELLIWAWKRCRCQERLPGEPRAERGGFGSSLSLRWREVVVVVVGRDEQSFVLRSSLEAGWDGMGWRGVVRDGMGWDGTRGGWTGRNGMAWEGMERGGVGRDGMRRGGVGRDGIEDASVTLCLPKLWSIARSEVGTEESRGWMCQTKKSRPRPVSCRWSVARDLMHRGDRWHTQS